MDRNNDDSVIISRLKINKKTKKSEVVELIPAPELPFGISLLWDQCKECGIKMTDSQEEKAFKEYEKLVKEKSSGK